MGTLSSMVAPIPDVTRFRWRGWWVLRELVVAFEPLQAAAEKLSRLLSASALDSRVRLRRQALSRTTGRSTFFVVHNMPEFSGLRNRSYGDFVPEQTEVQVEVSTIDSAFNRDRSRPVSFVKLDLEGGEFRALQGAEQTLAACGSCCVFENGLESSADDYGPDEFFGFFRRIDYELYDILGCRVDQRGGPARTVAICGDAGLTEPRPAPASLGFGAGGAPEDALASGGPARSAAAVSFPGPLAFPARPE